jgi:hypothetical protein
MATKNRTGEAVCGVRPGVIKERHDPNRERPVSEDSVSYSVRYILSIKLNVIYIRRVPIFGGLRTRTVIIPKS